MPKHFSHSTNTIKLFRNYGNDAKNYEILVRFCRFEGLQGIWWRHFGWKTVPCSCRGDGKRSVADSGQSCRRSMPTSTMTAGVVDREAWRFTQFDSIWCTGLSFWRTIGSSVGRTEWIEGKLRNRYRRRWGATAQATQLVWCGWLGRRAYERSHAVATDRQMCTNQACSIRRRRQSTDRRTHVGARTRRSVLPGRARTPAIWALIGNIRVELWALSIHATSPRQHINQTDRPPARPSSTNAPVSNRNRTYR